MPHTTFDYGFEWRVLEMAQALCYSATGPVQACLILLDGRGCVQTIAREPPRDKWVAPMEKLREGGQPYIFLDPFDAPEYTWLEWFNVRRSTMEQLMGGPFVESDFVRMVGRRGAPALDPPNTFPETWGVMF